MAQGRQSKHANTKVAKARVRQLVGGELDRLVTLREVNPNIRDVEIEFLQHQLAQAQAQI